MRTAAAVQEKSTIKFHEGQVLVRLAGTYATIERVILESVQNAIDSNALFVWVTVNQKKRTISIRDNGSGASPKKFQEALHSVAYSIKDDEALGQFGLGLISPIGKCEYFTFTSSPKSTTTDPGFYRWTFNTKEIAAQSSIDGIPMETVPKLLFSHVQLSLKGRDVVNWRTEVTMHGVTADRVVSRLSLDDLSAAIRDRFSAAMRRKGTTVYLKLVSSKGETQSQEVTAVEFLGDKLPVKKYDGKNCGVTSFNLFLSPKTKQGRKGKVSVGIKGNDYRIGIADFVESSRSLLHPETIDILCSGTFEGYVISESCELHPGRRSFVENDALLEFCIHLDRWAQEVGTDLVLKLGDRLREERYQALGIKSMRLIEDMLKLPEFEPLMNVVKAFKIGTIGVGHFEPGRVGKQQEQPTITTTGGVTKPNRAERRRKKFGKPLPLPKTDHPGHTPFTVGGPEGRRRRFVRGHSTGLQFSYEEMPGKNDLWELDTKYGVLRFNTRHPLWEQAEKKDSVLIRFQEHIAIRALAVETIPVEWREHATLYTKEELPLTLFLLENDNPFSRRKKRG